MVSGGYGWLISDRQALRDGSIDPEVEEGSLVRIVYRDHVVFRNSDHKLYKPALRETVGWLERENESVIWILWDRSVEKLPHERISGKECGLVILKDDVTELRKIV